MTLEEIFNQFKHEGIFNYAESIKSGHINLTYLIRTSETTASDYILQKINSNVFKNIPELIHNKILITNFLREKAADKEKVNIVRLIYTISGDYYFIDDNKDYWNLMVFIPNSQVYTKAPNIKIAKEAGALFGQFFYLLNDFDSDKLSETISLFHDINHRLAKFKNSIKQASDERLTLAKDYIEMVNNNIEEMRVLHYLKNKGILPLRATHNDTKLSNALFDKNDNGLTVIDLDTLMPGLVHYDFGDSVRTICSSAEEDEADLEKVYFLPQNFKAFTKGFLNSCKSILSEEEIKHLSLGVKYMVFIMGLRFLTDYLNKDIYFKTNYATHNLVRAKNQFALLKSMQNNYTEIQNIINMEMES